MAAIRSILGFPLYSDDGAWGTPLFSGGSWDSALPITNATDRRLALVARSTDALAASTTFDIDLLQSRDVRVLAILIPNLTKSSTPTIRWRVSTVSNFATSVYDSGTNSVYSSYSRPEEYEGLNLWSITLPGSDQTGRYVRCEIVDTANVDGYLDVARVAVTSAFAPTYGASVGMKLGYETESQRILSDGGAALYVKKPVRRYYDFVLDHLSEVEAAQLGFILSRASIHEQVLWVYDEAGASWAASERNFLGVLRELSALEYADAGRHSVALRVLEEL